MLTVHKYPLLVGDDSAIDLPAGARILRVDVQLPSDIHPTLWVLVDSTQPLETRRFRIVGTGAEIAEDDARWFVATVIAAMGSLVWHVFELYPPLPRRPRSSTIPLYMGGEA